MLLVDGDARSSLRLAELLAEDGYDVEHAADGAEALVRLAHGPPPDMLVTELSLRVGDGASVARSARTRSPQLRVVVLTRYVNSVVPASFGSPLPVVLGKPLEYERLLAVLEEPADTSAPRATLRTFPAI